MPSIRKRPRRALRKSYPLTTGPLEPRQMLASVAPFHGSVANEGDRCLPDPAFVVQNPASIDHSSHSFEFSASSLAPSAVDDELNINHGETAAVIPNQLLSNDIGGPLTITGVANAQGGTIEFRDSVVFFTPNGHGTNENLSFDYTVVDNQGVEDTATVILQENGMVHGDPDDEERRNEHRALFALIDTNDATQVAVQDGDWSNPQTWSTGSLPGTGDRVLIHHTVSVTYDLQSDAALDWLRVDGTLDFQNDLATRIVVETFVSDPRGTIQIGTVENPIEVNATAQVLIDKRVAH